MKQAGKNILVSVITVTYNHQEFIEEAIRGVLAQKVSCPCELLIGDDASNDNTSEIIASFTSSGNWQLKPVLREKNVGIQANFLDLLAKARGKYLAFCDGDDYWTDPFKLQKQVDALEADEGLAIAYHDCQVLNDGGLKDDRFGRSNDKRATAEELAKGNFMRTHSVMLRNEIGEYPHWIEEMPNPDYGVWMTHALRGDILRLNFKGGVYRQHPRGYWSVNANSWTESVLVAGYLKHMAPHFPENIKALMNERLARVAFFLYRHYYTNERYDKAKYYLGWARQANPALTEEKLNDLPRRGKPGYKKVWISRIKRILKTVLKPRKG